MARIGKILADAADVIGAVGDGFVHVDSARHPEVPAEGGVEGGRPDYSAPQARRRLIHQRVAQAGVLDALDRLADEGLDQQRLGFLGRNAARLEVEQQILVEIARGRAVAALHVVGEDLQFRLVVGLGRVRQQQRVRRHLGVGLLRVPAAR